ncbi:copper resistance protein CopC [Actinomarinicola tropica]|uniref:Copper resistance protein CopC n=1 Tax=Actinomarinicola tropica TaxID=2789776 RepID=A0A5Q2RRI8_9ACTN|nr:copper resistance protein CopC [Actinomarinicola tropica]QGG96510.1 hypothetical protein GH723_16155 [Actinomarinicola tropica]
MRPSPAARRPTPRAVGRALVVALGALVVVLGAAGPAGAHAVLVGTDPAPGALLDAAPDAVEVTFDEPVTVDPSSIVVIDETGASVGGEPELDGATVRATVPADAQGWFAVSWRVVSADGHPLSGAWTYRVGAGSDVAPDDLVEQAGAGREPGQVARWAWIVTQWGSTLFAAVLAGTVFVRILVGPSDGLHTLTRVVGVVGAALALGAAAANGPHIGPTVDAFEGPASTEMLVRAALMAVATGALLLPRRPGRALQLVAVVAAAAALAVAALSGHARAEGGGALVGGLAHLVLAGWWLGAAPALLVATRGSDEAGPLLRRFSDAAAWLLVGTVVLGLGSAALLSGGPGDVADDWGVILVAKLAFVLMAALAGGWVRFNVLPHIDRLPRREVAAPLAFEAVALVAVVTASIALTHNGPPRAVDAEPAAVDEQEDESVVLSAESDEATLTVIVDPAVVGTNDLHVYVTDRVGMPMEVEEVDVALSSAELGVEEIPVEMSDLGAGHLSTRVDDLGLAGTWEIRVTVRPTAFTQLELVEPFEVRPAP